ncbi:antiviral helicase SKI2-like protein [Aureococcus anophagefferens]|uniref:Antiviral helicase SKI2-like protein n=1 Tax=Aureococcus anophagefferens TaxID=44056 RepID=A0ABR1FXR7_AURAN
MAPTGSGKTAVALIAILQAFARGQRAVYTSPIKALSNQKFSEFTQWFRGRGIDAHVTLLTGDVKIRAPPGSEKELIICTSEILRNKLVKASGADNGALKALETLIREGHTNDRDPDLERLGCVVSDEIHYINDVLRHATTRPLRKGGVFDDQVFHKLLSKDALEKRNEKSAAAAEKSARARAERR